MSEIEELTTSMDTNYYHGYKPLSIIKNCNNGYTLQP